MQQARRPELIWTGSPDRAPAFLFFCSVRSPVLNRHYGPPKQPRAPGVCQGRGACRTSGQGGKTLRCCRKAPVCFAPSGSPPERLTRSRCCGNAAEPEKTLRRRSVSDSGSTNILNVPRLCGWSDIVSYSFPTLWKRRVGGCSGSPACPPVLWLAFLHLFSPRNCFGRSGGCAGS